ncbi:bacterial Ig-like domain-containing protein [Bacteroides caecigallinarum]|uniref:bacterial Ig-like domain-containing protein n=1 Tax=Bacteroides caecigallinarum TaxID=1411144 RepID=UPI001F18F94A|nr:bacterial Ig-like domain-containing protein [Bacteroides caecigallinarum]MCF2594030.1 bacterial Ig-like domain-containing protein [Bacteroides caecigallinarum]
MKNYNKIALACCSAAFGLFTLAGCEGGEIFEVDAPDWISDKVQEIEDANSQTDEDVYTFGKTDFSSGWWTDFSKYYVIPDGRIFTAEFELHINPNATNTYKNFALILTNDVDRGGEGYKEYGAIRFDHQPTGNSEWGDYIDRSYVQSNLTFETDTDEGIEKLGGKVTLTVDRTINDFFVVTMTNGVVTKTYEQPYELENLNAEESNTNIRCFLVVEGSYIDFLSSKIGTTGGSISEDKNPESMELRDVPQYVNVGTSLEEAMAGVTAVVTFEDVTKTVAASELSFYAIPDMNTPGQKTLVAAYNKTFRGENCDKPVMANAKFEVVESIESIEVTTPPSHTTYYYYTTKATEALTDRTMAFDPTGMVVTATESTGKQRVLDNSRLTFSAIPATAGTHKVTITAGEGIIAEVSITVQESQVSPVSYTGTVGATDNSTGFLQAYTDNFKVAVGETKSVSFTNYSNLSGNWNNFIVALRKNDNSLYYWLRADNYGRNAADVEIPFPHSGTQWVNQTWEEWLQSMNGAEVTVYVTNCGNGTADVQIEMIGNDNQLDTQYYLGANAIDLDDLYFALSVDGCHLVFE